MVSGHFLKNSPYFSLLHLITFALNRKATVRITNTVNFAYEFEYCILPLYFHEKIVSWPLSIYLNGSLSNFLLIHLWSLYGKSINFDLHVGNNFLMSFLVLNFLSFWCGLLFYWSRNLGLLQFLDCLWVLLFSFSFLLPLLLAMPTACGSSQAREQTWTTAVTQATAGTTPGP